MAIVGEIFDVGPGHTHYAPPNGAYHGFCGRDGGRAMATGDFDEEGLIPRVSDLGPEELAEVVGWMKFYREHGKYRFVGVLEGLYFDSAGVPTDEHLRVHNTNDDQEGFDALVGELKKRFKQCNQRSGQPKKGDQYQGRGQTGRETEIWCDSKFHGPRTWPTFVRYSRPGRGMEKGYCACIAQPTREAAEDEQVELRWRPQAGKLLLRFLNYPDCPLGVPRCIRPKGSVNPE